MTSSGKGCSRGSDNIQHNVLTNAMDILNMTCIENQVYLVYLNKYGIFHHEFLNLVFEQR